MSFFTSAFASRAVVTIAMSATMLIAGCAEKDPYPAGTPVSAKWHDTWHMATILEKEGAGYKVEYHDKVKATVTPAELKPLLAAGQVQAGQQVMAVWNGGRLYPGTVKGLEDGGARIAWEAHAFGFLCGALLIGPWAKAFGSRREPFASPPDLRDPDV